MAEGYDGDIKLSVGLDVSKTKFSLSELVRNIKKAFSSSDPQIKSMGLQMQKLSDNIDKTKKKIEELKNSKEPSKAFVELDKQIDETAEKLVDAKHRLEDLKNVNASPQSIAQTEKEIDRLTQQLDSLTDKMYTMKEAGLDVKFDTEAIQAQEQKLQYLETQASILNQKFKDANKSTITLGQRIQNLANLAVNAFRRMGGFIKTHFIDRMRQSTNSLRSNMRQLLRHIIGLQALIRVLRMLTGYAKEAFHTLAEEYPDINAQLSETLSGFNQFKNSMATMLQPLLSAVLPVLNTIINAFITAANAVGAFFAAITGQGYIYKATKQQENFAGAIGGVGGAAGEANEELAEYDKLLVVSSNDAGGGGGGGGGAGGGGSIFEKTPLNENITNFVDWIKEMWEQGDFTELGSWLAKKIVTALENIPWAEIKKTLRKIGRSIATFLNGLITPESLGALGTAIAEALNSAIEFAKGFLEKYDWKNLGSAIATGVTNFFKKLDAKGLGEAIHGFIAGGLTAAITFFTETDFKLIGQKIAEFIGGLNIPDLASKLYNLAKSILNALGDAIKGFYGSDDIGVGTKIVTSIALILGALVFTGKLTKMVSNILTALGVDMNGKTISTPKIVLAVAEFELVAKAVSFTFSEAADSLGFSELAEYYMEFADHPITFTIEGLVDIANFIHEEGFQKFADVLKQIFAPDSEFMKTLAKVIGVNIFPDQAESMLNALKETQLGADTGFRASAGRGTAISPTPSKNKTLGEKIMDALFGDPLNNADMQGTRNRLYGGTAADSLAQFLGGEKGSALKNTVKTLFSNMFSTLGDKSLAGAILSGDATEEQIKNLVTIKKQLTSGLRATSLFGVNKITLQNFLNTISDSGTSILGAFKSLNKENKTLNKSFSKLGNTIEGTGKRIDDATDSTTKYGTSASATAKQVTDSMSTVPDTMQGAVKAATSGLEASLSIFPAKVQTSSNNAWKNIADSFKGSDVWATTTSASIVEGFNNLPTDVGTKFGDAYKAGTDKFTKLYEWSTYRANDVKRGFSGMPGSVGRQFKDSYDLGTSQFDGTKTWIDSVVATIKGSVDETPGNFNSAFQDARKNAYDQVVLFRDWFAKQEFKKEGKLTITTPTPQSIHNAWAEVAAQWQDKHASFTIGVSASIENFKDSLNNIIAQFNANVGVLVAKGIVKNFQKIDPIYGHGGIVTTPTRIIAGDAGPEAVVPLARNTQWLGIMAGMLADKMAKGSVIPPNGKFLSMLEDQTAKIDRQNEANTAAVLNAINTAFENRGTATPQTVIVEVDGRQMAQVVWDENEKRYKQTGRRYNG